MSVRALNVSWWKFVVFLQDVSLEYVSTCIECVMVEVCCFFTGCLFGVEVFCRMTVWNMSGVRALNVSWWFFFNRETEVAETDA